MQAFEQYLLHEYQLPSNVVCNYFRYTHSTKQHIDKLSKVPVINNIIGVHVESYDDKHHLLASHSERFVDGEIKRPRNNALVNISPDELNNRFAAAKTAIVSSIHSEYTNRLNDINDKIRDLNRYVKVNGVIPTEFVNEPMIGTGIEDATVKKTTALKSFEF